MKGFLRVIFCLAIYGAVGTCLGEKPTAPFAIAISTPNHVVNSGSDVRLDIVMTNTSDHEFPIGRAIGDNQAELDYHIRVLDDQGKPAAETEYGRKVYGKDGFRFGSVLGDRLPPGDTLHEYTILSRIFDLRKPGTYTIQAQRTDTATKIIVKSNTLTLTVTDAAANDGKTNE